ncbi:MAG: hypothetical protein WD766_04495 [Gemmatimonadota bacterium]
MDDGADRSKARRIGVIVAALLLMFLLGFVPQWLRLRNVEATLVEARFDVTMLDLGGRLGAALAESQRGNYERARQLMAGFFAELQDQAPTIADPAARGEIRALLEQRDEVITLLSRAEPESVSRLNMMYTRYFAAVHPAGQTSSTTVTPSPPP